MKKIVIILIMMAIVIGGIVIYNNISNSDNKQTESNNKVTVGTVVQKKDYFLMYIDDIETEDSNTVLKGIISKGNIKLNEEVTISGLGKKDVDVKILKIKVNNENSDTAKEGDNVKLVLNSNVSGEYITKGQAVVTIGSITPVFRTYAEIKSNTLNNIMKLEEKVTTFNINTDIKCTIEVISMETNKIAISLDESIILDEGIEFTLKDGNNNVIAKGITVYK